MKTQIAPTNTPQELQDAVEAAVYLLSGGYPVALPTETVYGLAAWGLNKDALLRVFQTKERPFFDPLIIHLPSREWLDRICEIAPEDREMVERLTERFWPGPLTIILPRKPIVPDLVTAGLPTVAVRMSSHPVFREIIERFDQPLAAPSANRFGKISPTTAPHVMEELGGRIHLIVDGGAALHGVESTIVTLRGRNIWIMRNGPITAEQLGEVGDVAVSARLPLNQRAPNAPGQLKSHYAPATRMELLPPGRLPLIGQPKPWGLLAFDGKQPAGPYARIEVLSSKGDLREAAATLFAKLRALDSAGLERIVAESVPEDGLGAAIMDRLRKAAGNG
jgi:L-threonylcarbamoyladenylate synthase